MKITADMIPAIYNRPECRSTATVTLPSDGQTITGTMFGDSDCWDNERFYQYLISDDGDLYKLMYTVPADCDDLGDLDYENPEDALIAKLDDADDIPDHWCILDLVLGWKWA